MTTKKDLKDFPPTKVCSGKCGRTLPRTPEYFEPCKARTADGLRTSCRECERERDREYRRRKRAEKKAADAKQTPTA